MPGRLWACLAVLLLAVSAARPAHAQAAGPLRIVAIGDLHGDHAAWRDIARAARLIDARGRWTGGATILVQMGDVPDRGADSLAIIRDLMRLQKEARRAGGQVVALVGNHEAMNITGDLRYVSAGELAAFANDKSDRLRGQVFEANRAAIEEAYRKASPTMEKAAIRQAWLDATPRGMLEHQAAWAPNGEIGRWVISNPAVVLIDGTLFVHAGISAAYAGRAIADINRSVAEALLARDSAEASIINDPAGPLWYRGLARDGAKAGPDLASEAPAAGEVAAAKMTVQAELDLVLRSFGAQRMVIAHTPNRAGILLLHGGRLARIDTAISSAYGGTLSYLESVGGVLTAHTVPRSVSGKAVNP